MYRALALKALREKIALDDFRGLEALARGTHIGLKPPAPERKLQDGKIACFLMAKK